MTWTDILTEYMGSEEGQVMAANFRKAKATATISPDPSLVFRAYFETLCPFDKIKIVILGTAPNADPALADGLCLSSKKPDFMLPETRTFYNWMKRSIYPVMNIESFKADVASSSMVELAKQGVLMVNEQLSTFSGRPESHKGIIGWEKFTTWMMNRIATIKEEEGKPVMFVVLGHERSINFDHLWNEHLYVNIADPADKIKYDDLDNNTKLIFLVMSNFVADHYPKQAKSYHFSIEELIDWSKVDALWLDFIMKNNIPMPAIHEGVSNSMRDSIMRFSDSLKINGVTGELVAPYMTYSVGINYLLNTKIDE